VFTAVGPIQVTSNNRWITTLAARFGVTNGNWLFYGKAGGGWIGNEDFTVTNLRTGSSFNISNDSSNGGRLGISRSRKSKGIDRATASRRFSK
jgi:outer membrane immunogenic protein